jgi:hypothetical protein
VPGRGARGAGREVLGAGGSGSGVRVVAVVPVVAGRDVVEEVLEDVLDEAVDEDVTWAITAVPGHRPGQTPAQTPAAPTVQRVPKASIRRKAHAPRDSATRSTISDMTRLRS